MTLRDVLKKGQLYLEENQIPDAEIDAWYLLEHILKEKLGTAIGKAWFLAHQEEIADQKLYDKYGELLYRRGCRIPLQHLTGEQEFMGIPFQVNEKVLIPRQDTEILVEEVIKVLRPGMRVLDMCTGSGCIVISLMHYVPGIFATAADMSFDALEVARVNAAARQLEIDFRQGDLFETVEGEYDVIVSNPPYIPTKEIEQLMPEVKKYDPAAALDGGKDGLSFYRRITAESKKYLRQGGRLMLEIGSGQGAAVSQLMTEAGYTEIYLVKDLAGHERVAAGSKHPIMSRNRGQ